MRRLVAIALLAVAACGGGGGSNPGADVQWADYASGLQSRIDGEAAAKDCTTLQSDFDTADANNAATMSRTGHNNAKLMAYIDAKLRGAGCY